MGCNRIVIYVFVIFICRRVWSWVNCLVRNVSLFIKFFLFVWKCNLIGDMCLEEGKFIISMWLRRSEVN